VKQQCKPRAQKTRRGNEEGCLKSEYGYERVRRYRVSRTRCSA